MRIKHSKKPLPRCWTKHPKAKGILLEREFGIGGSRLLAKLLVFDTNRSLRHFWEQCLGKGSVGRCTQGVVRALFFEILTFAKDGTVTGHIEADPRYFCVIGLLKQHLSMEVISHEAVHVAYAYVKRIQRTPWDKKAKEFDEEAICYPSGVAASMMNRLLWKAGMY